MTDPKQPVSEPAAATSPAEPRAGAAPDPNEVVVMFHPTTGGVADTSRLALDRVWKAKGWQECTSATLDAFSKDQLVQMAAQRQISIDPTSSQAEILGRVKEVLTRG